MRITLCVLALAAVVPSLAHADCPVDKSVSVIVSCTADLIGGGTNTPVTFSDSSKPAPLQVTGPSKMVNLSFGDYRLLGELQCSGKSSSTMDWSLHVELTQKGVTAPLAYMMVAAADAAARKGKQALEVSSYEYLTPAVINPKNAAQKLTRVDYTCRLNVN